MKQKIMKIVLFTLALVMLLSACSKGAADGELIQLSDTLKDSKYPKAILKTNMGDITVVLFDDKAPKAVENFLTHAKDGYYDGVTFHRVIKEFMLQGGDPEGTGSGGTSIWGDNFEDEFDPSLKHFKGALAMANSGANTNGSQFFVVQNSNLGFTMDEAKEAAKENNMEIDEFLVALFSQQYQIEIDAETAKKYIENGGTPHLDGVHTVFGQVVDGMDVVNKIADLETDEYDKPTEDVIINSIEIIE